MVCDTWSGVSLRNSTRKLRTPSSIIRDTNSAPVWARALNTVLRQPASAFTGCSAPTRSRNFTSCASHGRPQSRIIRAGGKKRAKHAVLHVKHRHVLVDGDLEPFRRGGRQQGFELLKIQIVARRHPLQAELVLKMVRRQMVGDVQRKITDAPVVGEELQVIVIADQVAVGVAGARPASASIPRPA